jgi:hypothetical protein
VRQRVTSPNIDASRRRCSSAACYLVGSSRLVVGLSFARDSDAYERPCQSAATPLTADCATSRLQHRDANLPRGRPWTTGHSSERRRQALHGAFTLGGKDCSRDTNSAHFACVGFRGFDADASQNDRKPSSPVAKCSTKGGPMCAVENEQFRLEDYKLKLGYLNAQADRMWTRFNYFVTIQAGLVGLFAIASADQFKHRAPWAILAEVIVSLVWWMVGARDRFLWRAGRWNVEEAANALRVDGSDLASYKAAGRDTGYIPVGELDPFADVMRDEGVAQYRKWDV